MHSILARNSMITLLVWLFSLPLLAQEGPEEIPLWPQGAPGFEHRRNEPEIAKDWWIRNIHNPSITLYLPPQEKATGAGVVICPGGGHRELVFNSEGRDAAVFLNSIGVAAFALKYRLAREENSPYSLDTHPREDAYRAMRLVRSRAQEWGIDPNRVGMMGFSAGGEVVAMVAYASGEGEKNAPDAIDRLNGKPNFQILIYPGPLGIPEVVPTNALPAFLLSAIDDACCAEPTLRLLQKYFEVKASAEAHIYAQGAHAFNMGNRSQLKTISTWPQRLTDWLADNDFLQPGEGGGKD